MPHAQDQPAPHAELRAAAVSVLRTLRDHGHVAYLAGGCVRDELLGLAPTDYDIATDATPDRVQQLFKNTSAVGASFGVILVRHNRATTEVATFRTDAETGERVYSVYTEDGETVFRRVRTVDEDSGGTVTNYVVDEEVSSGENRLERGDYTSVRDGLPGGIKAIADRINAEDIAIFADESRSEPLTVVHSLRQQQPKPDGQPNFALADFLAPADAGIDDAASCGEP